MIDRHLLDLIWKYSIMPEIEENIAESEDLETIRSLPAKFIQ